MREQRCGWAGRGRRSACSTTAGVVCAPTPGSRWSRTTTTAPAGCGACCAVRATCSNPATSAPRGGGTGRCHRPRSWAPGSGTRRTARARTGEWCGAVAVARGYLAHCSPPTTTPPTCTLYRPAAPTPCPRAWKPGTPNGASSEHRVRTPDQQGHAMRRSRDLGSACLVHVVGRDGTQLCEGAREVCARAAQVGGIVGGVGLFDRLVEACHHGVDRVQGVDEAAQRVVQGPGGDVRVGGGVGEIVRQVD